MKALRNYLRMQEQPIHYGYIFRGSFEELGENSNILIESSLMKKIRQLVYNLPHKDELIFNNENIIDYITLRAYLNYSNSKVFIDLFPQYSRYYEKYKNFINELVNRILQCYRNKNIKLKPDQKIDGLATIFMQHINKNGAINPFDDICKNIIYDYIVDIEYIDLYSKVFGIK